MNGEVRITKRFKPTYKGNHIPTKPKLDKMGRKISEKNGMTLTTARYITGQRTASHLRKIFL
jgi:hypothetical protein